jgi:hypothetical protein
MRVYLLQSSLVDRHAGFHFCAGRRSSTPQIIPRKGGERFTCAPDGHPSFYADIRINEVFGGRRNRES